MADERETKGRRRVSPLEWVAATAGFCLTLALIGIVAWDAMRGGADETPRVRVEVEAVTEQDGLFHLRFRAVNEASATAANVAISGRLRLEDGSEFESIARLDYVPGGSERRGGLVFPADPREGELLLRAAGYADP